MADKPFLAVGNFPGRMLMPVSQDKKHAHKRESTSNVNATGVICYDKRVVKVENSHVKGRYASYDLITCAGGAYDLCVKLSHRTITLLEDIETSFEHHQKGNPIKKVDLYLHQDCARFTFEEKRRAREDAKAFAHEMFSNARALFRYYFKKRKIRVACFWVEEDGVVHRIPSKV